MKRAGICENWRERTTQNDHRLSTVITTHIWQSTLFAAATGLRTLPLKKESCADAVLGLANRIE